MKKVLVMAMCAVMCCLLLVGCGDSKYAGKYEADLSGIMTVELELTKDHKVHMVFPMSDAEDTPGTWELKDGKIIASWEGEDSMELTIEDKDTLKETTTDMIFKRV